MFFLVICDVQWSNPAEIDTGLGFTSMFWEWTIAGSSAGLLYRTQFMTSLFWEQ